MYSFEEIKKVDLEIAEAIQSEMKLLWQQWVAHLQINMQKVILENVTMAVAVV